MKEQLGLLVELQKIDSVIIEKTNLINAIPGKITSFDEQLKAAQALYDKQKTKYEAVEKKKKDKEAALEDMAEKLKKLKARLNDIKTNKEYQAHQKEIETAEKQRYGLEDEILALMEMLEAANRELAIEKTKIAVEKERIEAFRKKLEEEVRAAEKELEKVKASRTGHVKNIDEELYKLYFKVLKTKRGLAVVEARNERCLGCNMNIPPQLFVELKKDDAGIIQCAQCDRILYWKGKTEPPESKAVSERLEV